MFLFVLGLPNLKASNPKPRQMINVVRLYCWAKGAHWIEDYPASEGKKQRRRLTQQGVTVYHTELV